MKAKLALLLAVLVLPSCAAITIPVGVAGTVAATGVRTAGAVAGGAIDIATRESPDWR